MSYTEFHKGKFKIVARGDEAIKKYIKDNNLENRIEFNINEKTNKIEYLEDREPFNGDEYDHEYHMITYKRYLPNISKIYGLNPNAEHLLIKYLDHEYFGLDEGDIDIHKRISKDEFEFAISFYNGGCCEQEIYEDIISEFDLDENYENESEKISITPHESYMIYDALTDMVFKASENKDKYANGYKMQEIQELADRFSKIQIQNQW